jgi:hypothetical protein
MIRWPTEREQRIDRLKGALHRQISECGLDRGDAIGAVEDVLLDMITDSDPEFHDHVGAFLHRLYAAGMQVSLRLRDGVENGSGAGEF